MPDVVEPPAPGAAAALPLSAAQNVQQAILRWYAGHARDLPWRRPDASPWSVLVSELMLQQTPVARVLPAQGRAIARLRADHCRRARWPGAGPARRAARAARRRPVHSGGGGVVRVRPAPPGARYQRAPGPGPASRRPGVPVPRWLGG